MTVNARSIGLIAGPLIAAIMLFAGAPEGLSQPAWATAALLVLMAIWWATEPIPIPATSLLPLVVLPLVGAGTLAETTSGYSHHIVMLLLGGFIIALGIERWNLHKRIALAIVSRVGSHPSSLILGFMLATAALSMWISNTATTLMMVPIALSAAAALGDKSGKFIIALLLGVCYAASIGGVATPIGTPTNLIAIGWLEDNSDLSIGFLTWMKFGIPAAILLIPAAWWAVTRGLPKLSGGEEAMNSVREARQSLGRMRQPEKRAAMVFAATALLWVTRLPVQNLGKSENWGWTANYSDMGIAMMGASAMFLVPAGGGEKRPLLDWKEARALPWGVLILFGGGIALGRAVSRTGLSEWLGNQLVPLQVFPLIVFIAVIVLLVIFLTELTSNVATMTTLAPILGSLAAAIGAAPASLLAPAAVAASCAFMLPVATAPNAIIYATDEVPVSQMMRKGFTLNLIGVVIITAIGYWIAPAIL